MSNLIIDIGNTRTKLAVVDDGQVRNLVIVDKLEKTTLEDIANVHEIDAAIASVVGDRPDFGSVIPHSVVRRFHLLTYKSILPVTLDYETPETIGMDRVAAAVGARVVSATHDPLLVVDAGSCITIDLLDQHDVFRGGAIAPGLNMRFRALHNHTTALPLLSPLNEENHFITDTPLAGTNTRSSILSGVLNAAAFEIGGFFRAFQLEYPTIKLFLTGGDADFFAKRLFFPKFANPNLVVVGLDRILKMNL